MSMLRMGLAAQDVVSKSRLPILLIGGVALVVSSVCALAADWPASRTLPPPSSPAPEYRLPESTEFNGWYLRGDVGYSWLKQGGAEVATGFAAPSSGKINGTPSGSLGAGIKSGWLRSDITFSSMMASNYTATGAAPGDTTAKVTANSVLWNGYFDLGSWYRMTPYVGAGIGVANVKIFNYSSTSTPPFTTDSSRDQWNFAWAGMAGVAYNISPNLLVDVGYRYVSLGDVSTQADAFGSFKLKNIAAHEVRVGLRWNFEDAPIGR